MPFNSKETEQCVNTIVDFTHQDLSYMFILNLNLELINGLRRGKSPLTLRAASQEYLICRMLFVCCILNTVFNIFDLSLTQFSLSFFSYSFVFNTCAFALFLVLFRCCLLIQVRFLGAAV